MKKINLKEKVKKETKKQFIERLWQIRREENFTSWNDLKKELNLN